MNQNYKINEEIFKAYDIRGIAKKDFTSQTLEKIIIVLTKYFFKKGKILISFDARLSSPKIFQEIISLFKKRTNKIKIIKGGLMSTPMFYFLNKKLKTQGGIMITASHNPKEYNGLKIINKSGKMINGFTILKLIKKYD